MDYHPDEATISRFCGMTGCERTHAQFLLECCNGNFENAIAMFFEQAGYGMQPPAPPPPRQPNIGPGSPTPPRPPAPMAPGAGRQPARRAGPGLLSRLILLPFKLLQGTFQLAGTMLNYTLALVNVIGDRTLPGSWMRGIRGMLRSLGPQAEQTDPLLQAQAFIQRFKAAYGDRHPRFVEQSLVAATAQANTEFKFLFVYLHSQEHQDTDKFCRDVLCAPELVEYVNANFVSWGGDVRRSDAFTLSVRLGVTAYPAVALLAHSGTRTKLVALVQGTRGAAALLQVLQRAQDEQGMLLLAERLEQQERERNRELLQEQNQEFEAALAADREREERRQEERRRAEEEARAAEEAERRERELREAEERAKADALAALQRRREQKRAELPAEPAAGEVCSQIRIRLPDGSNHQRRFSPDSDVQQVFDFVDSLDETTFAKYSLVSNFPRQTYGRDSSSGSLTQLGLTPQAALFVQPDDE